MKLHMINKETDKRKEFKWGLSWCALIFGGWYYLVKGMWIMFGIGFLFNCVIGVSEKLAFLSLFYNIFLCVAGNRVYAKHLLNHGWEPATPEDAELMKKSIKDSF